MHPVSVSASRILYFFVVIFSVDSVVYEYFHRIVGVDNEEDARCVGVIARLQRYCYPLRLEGYGVLSKVARRYDQL